MLNESIIWEFLRAIGLNEFGIAGLMGNLYAESGLIPTNLQNTYERSLGMSDDAYTKAVDNGTYSNFVYDSAGYGLAQWTYWSRKQNLLNFAKAAGTSIGDLKMQLDFLIKELSSYGLLNALKTATSVREASDLILLNFEKPASVGPNATAQQREDTCVKRAGYGQTYFDRYATKKGDGSAMKYTSANPPLQCFMRQSTWYKNTKTVPVKGVLVHSTGANNPSLKRYVQPDDNAPDRAKLLELLGKNSYNNDWNHIYHEAGVHGWIGKLANGDVTSIQAGPWDKEAWGCGPGKYGSCNQGWIQFEICEDGLTDKSYFDKVYREAVELTAYLCKLYNLDPHGKVTHCGVKNVPVILCHQDSYQYGLGCNHGDVLHWFPKFGKSMDDFRNDVADLLNGSGSASASETPVNYQVQVTADDGLNCRTTYSTSGSIVTTYAKGTVLTVLKECNGWGFVGAGWVSLAYTKKIEGSMETEDDDMDIKRFKELMNEYRAELQDNDCGTWSQAARDWAISTGLFVGSGTAPDGQPNYMWADTLTREQAAQLLYRFAKMMGKA